MFPRAVELCLSGRIPRTSLDVSGPIIIGATCLQVGWPPQQHAMTVDNFVGCEMHLFDGFLLPGPRRPIIFDEPICQARDNAAILVLKIAPPSFVLERHRLRISITCFVAFAWEKHIVWVGTVAADSPRWEASAKKKWVCHDPMAPIHPRPGAGEFEFFSPKRIPGRVSTSFESII